MYGILSLSLTTQGLGNVMLSSSRPLSSCLFPFSPLSLRHLHHDHHKYNKEHTLSPFAGLAFHPIDGIIQAISYTLVLLFCPMHFFTHELLLFATGRCLSVGSLTLPAEGGFHELIALRRAVWFGCGCLLACMPHAGTLNIQGERCDE